jgi:hypothetical protein
MVIAPLKRALSGTSTPRHVVAADAELPIEVVTRLVRDSRKAQGLPERISDPAVLARLATLVAAVRTSSSAGA